LLLLALIRRKIGPLGFFHTAVNVTKLAICAIPCAFAAYGVQYLLYDAHVIIRFGASVAGGGLVYLAAAFILREMVLRDLIQLAKGFINKHFGKKKG